MSAEDDDICGWSYDHDRRLIDEEDGIAVYECASCGAEVTTEPDEEES